MSLGDFIRKQFVDAIHWTETGDGTLAWRFPMQDMEIQNGAILTVRESQVAVFVDEGRVADVFEPGRHRLGTSTLPLLTNLRHWDKLFESPFKSEVYFFSTRLQIDRRWGTAQAITLRDPDFGAIRLRAFGNYAFRLADPLRFHREVSGTCASFSLDDLDGQLRGLVVQHITDAVAESGIAFLDVAANLTEFAAALQRELLPAFDRLGLRLEGMTVQNVSLPDELQRLLDQRIGMGMAGPDLGRFTQYQTAQALPAMAAQGGGSPAAEGIGLGAGLALGQVLAGRLGAAPGPSTTADAAQLLGMLEKLGELHAKGFLSDAEFEAKKAELLKKIG